MSEVSKGKTSFFENASKKISVPGTVPVKPPVTKTNKSFLLLFYKNEALPFPSNGLPL
ncbi:hypothetical protein AruPA_05440 [Acidiphilium sp. PA]|uniref:hypothetical protein n=1 Tax=Acidiphilium sp. PA TaxID=2871705 RepID=UPI002244CFDE|nr:hypothetical protein [Acidiphilium sp. PA]MCW8306473.1 hypothetical protein [Acidiphilium sp. PA]